MKIVYNKGCYSIDIVVDKKSQEDLNEEELKNVLISISEHYGYDTLATIILEYFGDFESISEDEDRYILNDITLIKRYDQCREELIGGDIKIFVNSFLQESDFDNLNLLLTNLVDYISPRYGKRKSLGYCDCCGTLLEEFTLRF